MLVEEKVIDENGMTIIIKKEVQATVSDDGQLVMEQEARLKAPDGTIWRLYVDEDGILITEKVM
ncbi:MAG TPA: hypothetical protein ENG10_00750 [Candidatus Bathyarchaeota archaeon]|nr:hypothetical protein [Candidatus Bathyarchaeota archaeon]HEX68810.1 hypothetical protein [Candidatus Bathyarchaeota archaeon]